MSLINKVLRDLDARHAAEAQQTLPNEVRPLPTAERARPGRLAAVLAALLLVAGAGGWAALSDFAASPPAVPLAKAPPAALPAAAIPPSAESPALPVLVIAPPEPAAEVSAAPTPTVADRPAAPPSPQVSSLQLATTLRAAAVPAPPPARIEKQFHDDAHERAEAAYRAALAVRRQGRGAEAIASLRQALQLEPGHANARQLLLSLLVEQRQWPEAEAALREGLELMPSNAGWAMALARIQVERGQPDRAWATLERFMPAGESNADYRGFAGVLLQRLQQPAQAIGHYEAALRLKPDARWWAGLGLALDATGRADEAREAFRRAQAAGGLAPEMATIVEHRLK